MRRRHPVPSPIPSLWLMTDERSGDALWRAVRRLPRGAGIVFRHYATPAAERRRLFARLLRIARVRGLVLVRAGDMPLAGEMGVHGRRGAGLPRREAACHGDAEVGALVGRQAGAEAGGEECSGGETKERMPERVSRKITPVARHHSAPLQPRFERTRNTTRLKPLLK